MQHLILSIILCLSVSNTEDATKYSTSDLSGFDNISNHQENTMLIFGTVRNGTMPVAGADVHLVLNYADASHPYDDSNHAMTNADGEYFFETSVFDGYSNFNLTLNPWQNNSTTYFPALVMVPVPSTPQEFNFNSQPINSEITINSPNQSSLNLNINDSINLEALVALSFEDGSTTLSSVEFKMNNVVISNTNNQDIYSGTWTPSTTDYGLMHTFTVKAESSNNEMSTETFDFMLNCMGVGCPNILPQVMLVTPANTTINQSSGFQNIPIAVTATDSDGSIAMVNITINGSTTAMTSEGNNSFSYNFTPTNHQAYPIEITAIDNEGGSKTLNETLNITNSQFVPLPSGNIVLGYAHSWQTATAPFLTFNEIAENSNYNVVMYSFIITESDKYTPKLSIYENAYLTNGVFDKQLLIDDIDALRSKDIPVIASIGGATGEVELNDEDEKDVFVQGIINIVDEYGFDGVDIDFEGASMNFGAGALTDISYTGSGLWVFDDANEFDTAENQASQTSDFINNLEIYTGPWKPDFLAFDRFERDCFGPAGITSYGWTAKHWNRYLEFCERIAKDIGDVPIMLWQIPGGHLATTSETLDSYDVSTYSSAAGPFFLGDSNIGTNLNSIIPAVRNIQSPAGSSHYGNSDTVGELLAQDNNYDWATSNLSRLADMNIFSILWGGGSTVGTASIGTNGAGDDGWLAGKVNDYYDNVVFSTTADPAYQISCCFADAECKDITVQLDENNEITISAEDVYDGDTKCSGTALSVSPSSFNSTHIGPNTVTLTLTDDTNRETTCTAVVTVEPTLGIDDPELLLSAIVLYPNPADDVIHISNPKQVELQKVSIYDLNGRLLKTLKFNSVSTESIIDISTLTLAPYVVLIETPQGTVVKYLIKK